MSDPRPATPAAPLPEVRTPLAPADALARLSTAARRGRLPDYRPLDDTAFEAEAFATPFTHVLRGRFADGQDGTTRITFDLRRPWPMPAVFAVVLAVTVWPGVLLTDSLLATYWPAYGGWTTRMPWLTYAWYLPLTALPLPWAWRACVRRSAAMARESARETISKIARETDGTLAGAA